jgi:hypothetical protein
MSLTAVWRRIRSLLKAKDLNAPLGNDEPGPFYGPGSSLRSRPTFQKYKVLSTETAVVRIDWFV